MHFYIIVFPALLTINLAATCIVDKVQEMQEKWRKCSSKVTDEYYSDECKLVTSVVEDCGKLWSDCYNKEEMKRMKEFHLKALISQYGREGELEECQIVQEFRKSAKVNDDAEVPISCSEGKTEKAQKEFQECSHSAVTSFYENVENITEKKSITSKLCSTLNTIGSVCISRLSECFAQEDVKQMRRSHMKEIRSILRRITRDKLKAEDIKECEVIEVDEEERVTTDISETLINDEKGSGKDIQSKKYSSNHTKLMKDVLDKEEKTDFNEEIINQTSENQNSSVQEDENDNGKRLQDYSENTNAKAETFNSVTLHEKLTKEDIMLNTDAKENETLTLKGLSKNTAKKENCKYLILLLILILVMR